MYRTQLDPPWSPGSTLVGHESLTCAPLSSSGHNKYNAATMALEPAAAPPKANHRLAAPSRLTLCAHSPRSNVGPCAKRGRLRPLRIRAACLTTERMTVAYTLYLSAARGVGANFPTEGGGAQILRAPQHHAATVFHNFPADGGRYGRRRFGWGASLSPSRE